MVGYATANHQFACTRTRAGTYSPAAMFLMISIIRGEPGASTEGSAYPLACGENMQFVAWSNTALFALCANNGETLLPG